MFNSIKDYPYIKIGNKVKLANGDICKIISFNSGEKTYPVRLDNEIEYTVKGNYLYFKNHAFDIVDWNYEDTLTKVEKELEKETDCTIGEIGFTKHDNGKPLVSLVEPSFIIGLAEVMTQGADKYGKDNWKLCEQPERYLNALLRHTLAYWGGEKVDNESGKSHLYHIAFNAMVLDYLNKNLKD